MKCIDILLFYCFSRKHVVTAHLDCLGKVVPDQRERAGGRGD